MDVLNRQGFKSNIPNVISKSYKPIDQSMKRSLQPLPPHIVMVLETPFRNNNQTNYQVPYNAIISQPQFKKQFSPQKIRRKITISSNTYISPITKLSQVEKNHQSVAGQLQKKIVQFLKSSNVQGIQRDANTPSYSANSPIIRLHNISNKQLLASQYYGSQYQQKLRQNASQYSPVKAYDKKIQQITMKNPRQQRKGIQIFIPNEKLFKQSNLKNSKDPPYSLKNQNQQLLEKKTKKRIFTSKSKIKPNYSINRRKIFDNDSNLKILNQKPKLSGASFANSGTVESSNFRINEKLNKVKIYHYGGIDRMNISSKTQQNYDKSSSIQNIELKGIKNNQSNQIKNNQFDISSIIQKLQDKSRYYDPDEQSVDSNLKQQEVYKQNQYKDYFKKRRISEENNHQPTNLSTTQQKINDLQLIGRRTSMDKQFFDFFSPRNHTELPYAPSFRKGQDIQNSKNIVQPIQVSPNQTMLILDEVRKTPSKKLDTSIFKSNPNANLEIKESKLFLPLIAIISLAFFILLFTVIK